MFTRKKCVYTGDAAGGDVMAPLECEGLDEKGLVLLWN